MDGRVAAHSNVGGKAFRRSLPTSSRATTGVPFARQMVENRFNCFGVLYLININKIKTQTGENRRLLLRIIGKCVGNEKSFGNLYVKGKMFCECWQFG